MHYQGSAQDAPLRHLRTKIAEDAKKQMDGPEGAPNFIDQN